MTSYWWSSKPPQLAPLKSPSGTVCNQIVELRVFVRGSFAFTRKNFVRSFGGLSVLMDIDLGFALERRKIQVGAHGEMETPVPMPNTEVKHLSGYNTSGFARGKIARCRTID